MVGCGRVLKGWATDQAWNQLSECSGAGARWGRVRLMVSGEGTEGPTWSHWIISSFQEFLSEENLIFIASAGRWGPTLAVPLGSWKGLVNKTERFEIHLAVSFLAWFSKIWWKLNGYRRLRIYQVVTATGRMKTSCFLVGPSSIGTQNMMEGIYLRDI